MPEEYTNTLPVGTELDTYRVERVLGEGGFGITYLARELNLGKLYAIKELLPDGIAIRQGGETTVTAKNSGSVDDFAATRKYFISEARILAGMDHPAVVKVHRLMEANGTCYMVMDYVEGDTLGDYLKRRGGVLSGADEFQQIFYPLMEGLEVLHGQGIIHRDIKPGNIMVKPDGSPVLLDFGAATQTQSQTITITQMLSAGYSPFEQYTSRAKQGPYTDIYALGATMYKAITGTKPDDSSDRMYADTYKSLEQTPAYLEVYGRELLGAVDAALRMDPEKRPQNMAQWRAVMSGGVNTTGDRAEVHAVTDEAPPAGVVSAHIVAGGQTLPPMQASDLDQQLTRAPSQKWVPAVVAAVVLGSGLLMWSLWKGGGKLAGGGQGQELAAGQKAGEEKVVTLAGLSVKFRWCPPTGEDGFMMGSPATEKDRDDDEEQHKVVLTKGFWLMETEVTQGLWQAVMGSNPSSFKKGAGYPVEQVSWEDCQEFIRKVNASVRLPKGMKAALPTEAQWEYACRAGTQTVFHYGNSLSSRQANFDGDYPYGGASKGVNKESTVAVKSYQPNTWGLYDMHGNVWEWCADWYGDYGSGQQTDPPGARDGQLRVLRGGSWFNNAGSCRSAYRFRVRPVNRDFNLGFRLALQVENQ